MSVSWLAQAPAQEPKVTDLKGVVVNKEEVLLHGYVVELSDLAHPIQSAHSDVASDGAFVFRGIPYGDYVLKITDYYGSVFVEQFVTVRENQPQVEVRLSQGDVPRPASGHVSLRELQHPPTRRAVEAALAGQKLAESGEYERAAGELRRAVRISPDFAPAHANLAVQYIRLQRFAEAQSEIERAIEIAGPDPAELCNLAVVRAALQHYDEAAATAREALRIDPKYAQAHYILGSLLLLRNETRAEAIAHLERAAPTIDGARSALQRIGVGTK
jgi:tetratricopeptide (TPR) repeat protein